jgi:hypothetical protein
MVAGADIFYGYNFVKMALRVYFIMEMLYLFECPETNL